MRFMVIVKASKDSDKEGALPDPKGIADMKRPQGAIAGDNPCSGQVFGNS